MPEAPAKAGSDAKPEPQILFQHFFKSVGPRTYVAQVKEAATGNHFLLLTEGKRDDKTGDVRKTKLIVFSEDFPEFFRMVEAAAKHIQANPVPAEVKRKQQQFWARKAKEKRGDASSPNCPRRASAVGRFGAEHVGRSTVGQHSPGAGRAPVDAQVHSARRRRAKRTVAMTSSIDAHAASIPAAATADHRGRRSAPATL